MDVGVHPANTGGRSYVVTNGVRSYHKRFSPSKKELFTQTWRAMKLLLLYRRRNEEVSRDWARNSYSYNDVESWKARFAIGGGGLG
jgi:hypothetical protein